MLPRRFARTRASRSRPSSVLLAPAALPVLAILMLALAGTVRADYVRVGGKCFPNETFYYTIDTGCGKCFDFSNPYASPRVHSAPLVGSETIGSYLCSRPEVQNANPDSLWNPACGFNARIYVNRHYTGRGWLWEFGPGDQLLCEVEEGGSSWVGGVSWWTYFRSPESCPSGRVLAATAQGECVTPQDPAECDPDGEAYDAARWRCTDEPLARRDIGAPSCTGRAGNPVNVATGNKYQAEADYAGAGPAPLAFTRYYNSDPSVAVAELGARWRHTYDRSLAVQSAASFRGALVYRPDGRAFFFYTAPGGAWVPERGITARLSEEVDASGETTGWVYTGADEIREHYDASGRLTEITPRAGLSLTLTYGTDGSLAQVADPFGRTLAFAYDAEGRIQTLTDPDGGVYTYAYDASDNLVSVTYPDDTPGVATDNPTRQYHYENTAFPHHLTGITDANGERFATWAYDAQGRAILSEHAGGAEHTEIAYNADGTTTVTDPLGATRTYSFGLHNGEVEPSTVSGDPCTSCGAQAQGYTYDANGFLASRTDFNGNVTTFVHDARGLETSRTEAAGTPAERTISTQWHPSFRLPTRISEPGQRTDFAYDGGGRLLSRTVIDTATGSTRTTTYTYTPEGLLAATDGARTDVADITTRTYDTQGNLTTVTDALGHLTRITAHDASGRPLRIEDPNGVVSELAYDARGRLASRTLAGLTTTFDYDAAGNLIRTTLPDGSFLDYTYDPAHRLTAIEDAAGNRIEYTLDTLGNRTREDVRDPAGALRRTQSRVYDTLNRLVQHIGGAGHTSTYAYDANGNRTQVTDPLGNPTTRAFDALNRLVSTEDALSGVTELTYDARDNVTRVTDPRGLVTTYVYDGLDEPIERTSPDTGTTTLTYDAAGNRITETDARGVTVHFTYDALNRLTGIDYPDDAEDVAFTYDEGTNGIGRLTGMADASGTTTFTYDARGNLTRESATIDGVTRSVGYAFDAAERLIQITYPSGRTVDYVRDAIGRIESVTTTFAGVTETLASAIGYLPFGPLTGLTFGNGIPLTRSFDADYRLATQTAPPAQDLAYTYDPNDNITAISNNLDPAREQAFGYDALDRLTAADGPYGHIDYAYDAVGNRTLRTENTGLEVYDTAPDSNRLTQLTDGLTRAFTYDAAGNTVDDGRFAFAYGDNNRLTTVSEAGSPIATYVYNARGERVKKTALGATTLFTYDRSGQLLAESDDAGNTLKEYVYLDGRLIAAMVASGPGLPSGDYRFAGIDEDSGETVALTVAPGERAIALESPLLSGTFQVDAAGWHDDGRRIRFTHRPDERTRIRGRLRLSADTPGARVDVDIRPRHAAYLLDTRLAENRYAGVNPRTGEALIVSVNPGARTLTLAEAGRPLREITIPRRHWHRSRFRWLGALYFQHREGDLRVEGLLWMGRRRVHGWVLVHEGRHVHTRYRLSATAAPPSEPTGTFFIHTDHLGTPQVATDATQGIAWAADYQPFGEATVTTEAITVNLRFPGQYFDHESGLHYNYYRDYDAQAGRYIVPDPGGMNSALNGYLYANANPIRHVDPNGLEVWSELPTPSSGAHLSVGVFASSGLNQFAYMSSGVSEIDLTTPQFGLGVILCVRDNRCQDDPCGDVPNGLPRGWKPDKGSFGGVYSPFFGADLSRDFCEVCYLIGPQIGPPIGASWQLKR